MAFYTILVCLVLLYNWLVWLAWLYGYGYGYELGYWLVVSWAKAKTNGKAMDQNKNIYMGCS